MKSIWLVILILILAACAPGTGETVELKESDSGRTIQVKSGALIKVSLESNLSTGYSWAVKEINNQILQQQGEPEFIRDSDLKGSGETTVMTFKALQAGESQLYLVYMRPFEADTSPEKTYEVQIQVK